MVTLYENQGWGSAIVEAQLAFYGLLHRLNKPGDVHDGLAERAALKPINPLAQVPTLVLADGQIIPESAAMTLLLADVAAQSGGPWLLGARMMALDVYFTGMVNWTPRENWVKSSASRLVALALRAGRLPIFAPVMQGNFR